MVQFCNQSRSQRHGPFLPSGRTFQVIFNRNFHSKSGNAPSVERQLYNEEEEEEEEETIFIRNEVNIQYLGYSSIDQLPNGPLRSNCNTARHRTESDPSVAQYIARPAAKGFKL